MSISRSLKSERLVRINTLKGVRVRVQLLLSRAMMLSVLWLGHTLNLTKPEQSSNFDSRHARAR